jgi:hypothetical protein
MLSGYVEGVVLASAGDALNLGQAWMAAYVCSMDCLAAGFTAAGFVGQGAVVRQCWRGKVYVSLLQPSLVTAKALNSNAERHTDQPCLRAQPCMSEQPCMQGKGVTACLAAWCCYYFYTVAGPACCAGALSVLQPHRQQQLFSAAIVEQQLFSLRLYGSEPQQQAVAAPCRQLLLHHLASRWVLTSQVVHTMCDG